MDLGAVLRAARERTGLSQEELAEKLNRSRTCITKFENNIKEIKWSEAIKWGRLTNGQDIIIAAMLAVDPVQVASVIDQLTPFIGTILLF
ncbi:helix-turn-helix domain-containing protein [Salipaludibacillus sp. HK11]|uniref:helix-turn-helix domain-containing protein n=1 Tax=Salipaludibacillus sp. HK11 TaxID=3394320 RepID=UPI0039FBF3C4